MREKFIEIKFKRKSLELIRACQEVIDRVHEEIAGPLSVRQVFYGLVGSGFFISNQQNYDKTINAIRDGRLTGLLDWSDVEDRNREALYLPTYRNPKHFLQTSAHWYLSDHWAGQDCKIELWAEKATLTGILEPLALGHQVTLLAMRGFPSLDALYKARDRFASSDAGSKIIMLISDADPAGYDMERDIRERLCADLKVEDVEIRRLGLTVEQAKQLNAEKNYVKEKTDTRAKEFIRLTGGTDCYELEGVSPAIVTRWADDAIKAEINSEILIATLEAEEANREALLSHARHYRGPHRT